MRVATILSALLLLAFPLAASAGDFPNRPTGVTLTHPVGLLVEYGAGEGLGTFLLRSLRTGAETRFRIGYPMTVDGHTTHCLQPGVHDRIMCEYWPSVVVVGKTVVRATCWVYHDRKMFPKFADLRACDRLDIVHVNRP